MDRTRPSLAVCIPTFNRAQVLRKTVTTLRQTLPSSPPLPIYISDNHSDDETPRVVAQLQRDFDDIHAFRQPCNLLDLNFPSVLKQSREDYAWLLGDKILISSTGLAAVRKALRSFQPDLVVVNNHRLRVRGCPSGLYEDPRRLLVELGWYMTLISSLIFSRRLIEAMDFDRYRGSSFLHLAPIFEYFASHPCRVAWVNEPCIYPNPLGMASPWHLDPWPVFLDSWCNAILSLPPSYALEDKLTCILAHGVNTRLFSFKGLVKLRSQGALSLETWRRYRRRFGLVSTVPSWALLALGLTPRWLACLFRLGAILRQRRRLGSQATRST